VILSAKRNCFTLSKTTENQWLLFPKDKQSRSFAYAVPAFFFKRTGARKESCKRKSHDLAATSAFGLSISEQNRPQTSGFFFKKNTPRFLSY
jgi:hypothetical protein